MADEFQTPAARLLLQTVRLILLLSYGLRLTKGMRRLYLARRDLKSRGLTKLKVKAKENKQESILSRLTLAL